MSKQSKQGLTVKKDENFSEWYSQIIQKADLADIRFGIQGFIVHKPWGFFMIKKLYEYLEEEVEKQGHLAYQFPIAVKEENLKKEKEHAGFTPEVFWVSEAGSKKMEERFALRPTGEAQIYPLYSLWFRSHKDIPFRGYQSRISVYRNEMTTRPFIRGREFLFFETHDVFNTHKEALDQIDNDLKTCKKVIYEKVKIPFIYFKRPQWDKFKGADNTFTPDTLMPDGKRNQLASTHDLGQNFAKAFNIKIIDKDEKEQFVWQTCFGPGIWRIFAAMISIHGDDKGLIVPFDMAPLQIVVIPIIFKDKKSYNKKINKISKEIELRLKKLNYRVKIDDREETPGFKYNHWELFGVPIKIELGPNEAKENSLTLSLRTEGKKVKIKINKLEKEILNYQKKIDLDIKKKADNYFKDNTRKVLSLKELKVMIDKYRGFIKAPFCSTSIDGEKCADIIKAEADGAYICGTLYPKEEKPSSSQKCIVCNKKAKHMVYIAKSY